MEIGSLKAVELDAASNALLRDIDDTARKVNELRPLKPDVLQQILSDMLGERIQSSNAIEGNALSLGETEAILRTNNFDFKRRREATEVLNLNKCIRFVESAISERRSLFDAREMVQVHELLMKGLNDDIAGRLRSEPVMIRGAKYQPPDSSKVDALLEDAFAQARSSQETHPLILAVWTHWAITRIHPFVDGNGRIARLWQDWLLFSGRLTCAMIPIEVRGEYLQALGSADSGNFNPLLQLTGRRVLASFDRYLSVIGREQELQDWAAELVGEVDERAAESQKIDYLRWQRVMESLRFAMERCAASVNQKAAKITVDFRKYETIDQNAWENISNGITESHNWFFSLTFRSPKLMGYYLFFFGRHFSSDLDNSAERAARRPCLLIAESINRGDSHRLDELDINSQHPVTLRELFTVDNQLVRRRREASVNREVYDRDADVSVVAKEFFQQVILGHLTV